MYVNKCIKCGREFETKNPKRVICPDCLYPDKNMMVSSSSSDVSKPEAPVQEPLNGYSAGGNDDAPRYYSAGGGEQQPRYNRPQRPYNNNRGGYNNNRQQGGYQQNRQQGGYNRGGYNNNRQQGNYNRQGGYQQNRPQQGGFNRNNNYNKRQHNNDDDHKYDSSKRTIKSLLSFDE